MDLPTIAEEHDAAEADLAAVRAGLREFNHRHMPQSDPVPLRLLARDGSGAVRGGLLAETRWHWLFVSILWVADEHRGRGLGRSLLARAEAIARGRGCRRALVDTAAFQALGFYRKAGYRVFGELDDCPPGSRTFYLAKQLGDVGPVA